MRFLSSASFHPVCFYSTERPFLELGITFFPWLVLSTVFVKREIPFQALSADDCRAWEFNLPAQSYSLATVAQSFWRSFLLTPRLSIQYLKALLRTKLAVRIASSSNSYYQSFPFNFASNTTMVFCEWLLLSYHLSFLIHGIPAFIRIHSSRPLKGWAFLAQRL